MGPTGARPQQVDTDRPAPVEGAEVAEHDAATDAPLSHSAAPRDWIQCPLCAHGFHPGHLPASIYCPRCGGRFDPHAAAEDTVAMSYAPAVSAVGWSKALEEADAGAEDRPGAEGGAMAATVSALAEGPEPPEEDEAHAAAEAAGPGESDVHAGKRFGAYDILREVARGGMGVIYKAEHRVLKREVALKVLRAGEVANEEDIARFMREAKSAARLSHPNIVPIHELSMAEGQHFFTMDFVQGTPLDRMLDEGPLPPNEACRIIHDVAKAIHYAHGQEIIHRDLKPANIIVDLEGRPMVTDFGLAVSLRSTEADERMTRTGAVMGTLPYIPPEQAAGHVERIGPASDVYSLGAVLYETITGRPPVLGETQYELLRRIIHQDPPKPRDLNPRLHPDVETICMKCLEKDPNRRYASALAVAEDCAAFIQGEMIKARPASYGYKLYRRLARRPAFVALGGFCLLLAIAIPVQSILARKQTEAIRADKDAATLETKRVQREKNRIEARVKRTWRREFLATFPDRWPATTSRSSAHRWNMAWFDKNHVWIKPEAGFMRISSEATETPDHAFYGLPTALPFDFRLMLRVRVPEEGAGGLLILLGVDESFRRRPATRILALDAPGQPGARFHRGDTLLAEAVGPALPPGGVREVELSRIAEDGRMVLRIDGEEVMTHDSAGESIQPDEAYLGLAATGGALEVTGVEMALLGLSREMIRSLLEMAESLALEREYKLAARLNERVMREKTGRPVHVRAYGGYAQAVARSRNASNLKREVAELFQGMFRSGGRPLEPGEAPYLMGRVMGQLGKQEAHRYFQSALHAAHPPLEELVEAAPLELCGPFPAPKGLATTLGPETGGAIVWQPLEMPAHAEVVPLTPPEGRPNAIWYIRRRLRSEAPMQVDIATGSDDGMALWLNGELLKQVDRKRSIQPASEEVRAELRAGENVLLMKVHNRAGAAAFALRMVAVDPPPDRIGAWGLLARLESALTLLANGRVQAAEKAFTAMQRDTTLEVLTRRFPEEVKARAPLATVLPRIDRLLNKPTPTAMRSAWILLEAMRALQHGGGRELALRYQRLAEGQIEAGRLTEANAALRQAVALAPDWHPPRMERALLHFRQGRVEEGVATLEAAADALPESLELRLAAAEFYLDPTRIEGVEEMEPLVDPALAMAREAAALSERRNAEALALLARAALLAGEVQEAATAIEEAIVLEPSPARTALRARILEVTAPPRPVAPEATPTPAADAPSAPPEDASSSASDSEAAPPDADATPGATTTPDQPVEGK